ncbi:MAG: cyclic-di-AMP-binding protein CbpB [Eubacteriales bacterium]|nr:cyclic-di-AMP-binding protein CbpB [Eubacteriales bacterium]
MRLRYDRNLKSLEGGHKHLISPIIEKILLANEGELFIEGHKVATVRTENTCLHAIMILNTVGYSSVPVLDREGRVAGKISAPLIFSGIKEELCYNWDKLAERRVSEDMSTDVAVRDHGCQLEDILHDLVNHSFICLVDESGFFRGIITRKEILKRVNFLAHEFEHKLEEMSKQG